MRKYLFILIITICTVNVNAQDWEKRHKFAKAYFGVSNYISTNLSNGIFLNSNGDIQQFKRNSFLLPSINIGATHFWGYADFYVSINTTDIKFGNDEIENGYNFGAFTGLRFYPLATRENTIRPYLGYKISPFRYRQTDLSGQNYKFTQVKSIFDVGLGIQLPNFYFTLEYGRVLNPEFDVYLSREIVSRNQFPKHLFQVGLNYTIETTKSASTETNRESNELFSSSNKWGFFLATGPSSSFPLVSSSYITDLYPFLDDKSFPTIFPDIAMGYHFTKSDLIAAISFRPITQKRSAFGFEQTISRKSLNLETYKFFGDYHGFVPFAGLGLSYENIKVSESNNGIVTPPSTINMFSPNFVFGWDIRPSIKGDWWILRTNLRYFPFLDVERQGKKLSLQHLEFNFIQFVFYPQRLMKIKKR
jgi:outer membrane protein W